MMKKEEVYQEPLTTHEATQLPMKYTFEQIIPQLVADLTFIVKVLI